MNAVITALGGYVPEFILTNEALTKMVDTTDEWIEKRTGIKERRIADKDVSTSTLAAKAIQNLFAHYDVNPLEVDGLILATATPDYLLAPTAAKVCELAGLQNAFGLDLNAACSGFLSALTMAASMIESSRYKKVMVVGADKMSSIVDYTDRNTCVLFGDGAGAVLLEACSSPAYGVGKSIIHSDGSGSSLLLVPAGGSKQPASAETVGSRQHYIRQDGPAVYKNAVSSMSEVSKQLLAESHLAVEDIDWVVPHQANVRIIKAVSSNIGIPFEKVKVNIQQYGNTTSATIPLCLWDFKEDFKEGQTILLTSFGAGFTWGALTVNWGVTRRKL